MKKYDFCYLCNEKITKFATSKGGKKRIVPLPKYTCVEVGLKTPRAGQEGSPMETIFITPVCRSCAGRAESCQKTWPIIARRVLKYSLKENHAPAPSIWTKAQKDGNYEIVGVYDITQRLIDNKVIRE